MAGLTEEGAKIAGGLIDTLRTQPSTLAMIVISFGLLGYTFYEGHSFNQQRFEMTKTFVDFQKQTQELLSRCVVPNKSSFGDLEPLKSLVGKHEDQR